MVDRPTSAVGVFHWVFHIAGGQESDRSGGDRHVSVEHVLEQCHPRIFPWSSRREVQRQLAGGVGDPCGNRNYFVTYGAGGRFHQRRVTGQSRCGAGEIERHHRADEPGSVRAKMR